ncbi:MAG: hypothetical protein HPY85_12340 [Anaerolineae bacterium]|nr:hypothetical protein [Anaerolineae bacterium]
MTVRIRLSVFYAILGFSFLAIFSVGLISMASAVLIEQIDAMLLRESIRISEHLQLNPDGGIEMLPMQADDSGKNHLSFQLWDNRRQLIFDSRPQPISPGQPLSPQGFEQDQPVFTTTGMDGERILSTALVIDGQPYGEIQVAYSLSAFSLIENRLVRQMALFTVIAVIITGFLVSTIINRDLKRVTKVTETVRRINESDDPSLRIEDNGPIEDEIGQLTKAFNETMARLENIINSQRRFLADVSHELRTPMTIIKGNVDIMRRFGELDDESLNTIESQTDRLTRLVNSLLLLEQVESGQVEIKKSPVNMADLFLEVFQEMVLIAEYRQQRMQVNEIDLAVVAGNRDQLKQVLLNLVSNAINYTPDGGEIQLSLKREGPFVRIAIQDSGPGIAPEDLPHLFERFYRSEKARTRESGSGFGLGLSIAYWIVRNHNGRIEVNSRLGEGTQFSIYLPVTGIGLS